MTTKPENFVCDTTQKCKQEGTEYDYPAYIDHLRTTHDTKIKLATRNAWYEWLTALPSPLKDGAHFPDLDEGLKRFVLSEETEKRYGKLNGMERFYIYERAKVLGLECRKVEMAYGKHVTLVKPEGWRFDAATSASTASTTASTTASSTAATTSQDV